MATIHLRDYYPSCPNDMTIEISDMLAEAMRKWVREEKAYARKRRWHHAHYSLEFSDNVENHVLSVPNSPEILFEKRMKHELLYHAISSLPEKQARRIGAHYLFGLTKAEIARKEGVTESAIKESISLGLQTLNKLLKEKL